MKQLSIYKYCKALLMAPILLCLLPACQEEGFPVDGNYARMFKPHTLAANDVTATSATLEWPSVTGTQLYIVDLSKDSLQFTSIVHTYEINADEIILSGETKIKLNITNLIGDTKYSARIKTTSKKDLPESGYSVVYFKTNAEQIMKPVSGLEYTTATLNWVPGSEVTHIKLTPDGESIQTIQLTQEEIAAGAKVLTGLAEAKSYNVEIYNTDSNRRGYASFTTYLKQLPIADLTIQLLPTDSINKTTFDTLTASSVTLVLPKGSVYTIVGFTIKDNISVNFYGIPVGDLPTAKLSMQTEITLPATAGTIRFENLNITGYKYANGGEVTTSKAGYIFNVDASTVTNEVVFENCTIRNFTNSPFRIKGTNNSIGKLVFNNCVAFDCGVNAGGTGSYAFIHTNVATAKIDKIEITNSTIYNIGFGLILHSGTGSASVKIENCTFDDIIGNGRYFVDYGTQTITNFSLSNCIFGKTKSSAGTAKGIRVGGGNETATNSYRTNDFVTTSNAIGNLIDYNNPSTSLFVDPANGNFNFKDQNFEGVKTTGDPRWRINL